jgi:hypothetical protein
MSPECSNVTMQSRTAVQTAAHVDVERHDANRCTVTITASAKSRPSPYICERGIDGKWRSQLGQVSDGLAAILDGDE